MEIYDVLFNENMLLNVEGNIKEEVLSNMVKLLVKNGYVSDYEGFLKVIKAREAIGNTAIGDGLAIPHGQSEFVLKPCVLVATSNAGVACDAIDKKAVKLFFMIATPINTDNEHLNILSKLSTLLLNKDVQLNLLKASTSEEMLKAFNVKEVVVKVDEKSDAAYILAVTGCSTGIAHTYMAAEKLKETAASLNVKIKVETNGSTGIENLLTSDEINKADGIIVASDINVAMVRFNGKPLVKVPVAKAISDSEGLINKVVNKEAKTYVNNEAVSSEASEKSGFYKHILSGVSHMLPFVIGGGILIALAFMIDQIIGVPQTELANLGSYNEFARYFKDIGGTAFGFMLPVLAGYIAYSISDRPALVIGFVGGGLASTGGAGFLGAILAGFLAGYTVLFLKKVFSGLPKSLDGIKVILFYPVFGVLIIGVLMLLLNIPMKQLNDSMNNFLNNMNDANAILLGVLLGTMMAIDLGGPINKAAYIFGTGTLATSTSTGGSAIMAAVMAAGMVPPLATFVSTRLYAKKYDSQQQQAGLTNLVLGASFITEGAIPFAANDPIKNLFSFIIGSAITGGLVMFSNILVLAPHGGIFVIMLVSNPLLYLGYIILGSVISGVLLGTLKKN